MALQYNSKAFTLCGYLIITLLAIASCISSLFGDFVFDDTEVILNNKDILPSTPLGNIFSNDYWGTNLKSNLSHKSYRPLTILSFRMNYVLFGGLQSWHFHLVNIVLHVIISTLSWSVFCKVLGEHKNVTGFLGAILFSVHPVHSEAVCGVVGRADLLSALFFFLSFLAYAKIDADGKYKWLWFVVSLILATVALFCKEQGITVIGVCCVYDILVINKIDVYQLLKNGYTVLDRRKIGNTFIVRFIVSIIITVFLLWFRYYLMDFQGPTFQQVDNPASFEKNWLTRVLTYNYIFGLNLWILLCPEWLCFDWSMGCIPVLTATDPRIIFVFIFWFSFSYILWKAFTMQNAVLQKDMLMALALMVIPFLPASNLFFRVGFVIAERVLYIPSIGFCLLIVCGIEKLVKTYPSNKSDITFGFSLLMIVFLIRSHERSLQWRSEYALFNSGADVCPLNAKIHYNIGKRAVDSNDIEKAIFEYQEAIRLYPEYDQALNNLANVLKNKGELDEAESLLRKALSIREEFPAAWMNLGIVLSNKKKFSEAETCYFNALKYRKFYPDCYYNLGNLYLEQNRYDEAEKAWLIATKMKPNFTVAWNNLIILNDNNGNHSNAVKLAEEALEHLQDEPSIHFNMANALGKLGEFQKSESHFLKALKLNPNNAHYHVNLGVLYHRWKKYRKAEESYKKALKINPGLKSAKENYGLLKKSLDKDRE